MPVVIFAHWREALNQAALSPAARGGYALAIGGYLDYCRHNALRSGTSALPNHGEAQAAESTNDFVHKLKLCLKELRESYRWLLLVQRVPLLRPRLVEPLVQETDQLIRIFVRSIQTARKRR